MPDSPGRWYVSLTLKQVIVHLVMNFDLKIEDEKTSRYFFWTTAIVPRPNTRILLRRRENVDIEI
jgi:hypothetical protein